jgi:hypothetical protein
MKRLYAFVVALHPRRFRREYGTDMKLLFADLLDDPAVSKRQIWAIIFDDVANLTRGVRIGALFGLLVVLIWLANRSIDIGPHDPPVAMGVGLMALLFVAAGFIGARRSGNIAGGIWVGFVAGLVSSVTVPGDYWLFGYAIPGLNGTILTLGIAAAVVMILATVGALLPGFTTHRLRVGRSIGAFVGAWRQDSELSA